MSGGVRGGVGGFRSDRPRRRPPKATQNKNFDGDARADQQSECFNVCDCLSLDRSVYISAFLQMSDNRMMNQLMFCSLASSRIRFHSQSFTSSPFDFTVPL